MPYDLTFRKSTDFVHAAAKGEFTSLEELFAHLDEVVAEAKERHLRKILLDFSELRARVENYHATFFTEGLLDRGYPRLGLRFAALVHPEDYDKAVAFEIAFHNRAILNKAFTEYDAAVRWLRF